MTRIVVPEWENLFHTQRDALHFQHHHKSLRLFTFEYNASGSRKFLVSDVEVFWERYKDLEHKFYHEVIQERMPCRLYFDLEYHRRYNRDIDENKMIDKFIEYVNKAIKDHLRIDVDETSWLMLDSSSKEKFSVHCIVHFPDDILFPSNAHLKEFIEELKEDMECRNICIVKNKGFYVPIIDTSVYSRNRQFRLFLSTKYGEERRLLFRKGCKFYKRRVNFRRIFLDSLVIPVNYNECPLLKKCS